MSLGSKCDNIILVNHGDTNCKHCTQTYNVACTDTLLSPHHTHQKPDQCDLLFWSYFWASGASQHMG